MSTATISVLPVSLFLVHIPRSRLAQLSHSILHQILQPNPTFLNITCNEIELSLFAEQGMLAHFEPVALKDKHRQRSRSDSGSGSSRRNVSRDALEPIEISHDAWSVLQIDSHSDQMDDSGARINELSAPLAEAGISILYQSSYTSEFIFVKEACLRDAMSLFASAGFDLYLSESDAFSPNSISPPMSPIADDGSSMMDIPTPCGSQASSAILTRTRNSSLPSDSHETISSIPSTPRSKSKSHSPASGEVDVLTPDLICVGLSNDSVEQWSLKIVKLVAFPDLIPTLSQVEVPMKRGALMSTSWTMHDFPGRTYVMSNDPSVMPPSRPRSPALEYFTVSQSQSRKASRSCSPVSLLAEEPSPPSPTRSESDSDSSLEEDQYFSESTTGTRSSSLFTDPLLSSRQNSTSLPSKPHIIKTLSPLSPIVTKSQGCLLPPHDTIEHPRVPFFSFTRTQEGSSLTTDAELLATLFPESDRHMVICGGELDAIDERITRGEPGVSDDDDDDDDDDDSVSNSTLKCLQIDLRKFGLDKHGLVNRFSKVLEEENINHMYSSTFKTANLLVNKKHALRAQSLLRTC